MNEAIVAIACAYIKPAIQAAIDRGESFEDQCRTAMKKAHRFYMSTDDNDRFAGAVAAIMEFADAPTKERILAECESIKMLNAVLSGVPVDFERVPVLENPIGLLKMYQEANPC